MAEGGMDVISFSKLNICPLHFPTCLRLLLRLPSLSPSFCSDSQVCLNFLPQHGGACALWHFLRLPLVVSGIVLSLSVEARQVRVHDGGGGAFNTFLLLSLPLPLFFPLPHPLCSLCMEQGGVWVTRQCVPPFLPHLPLLKPALNAYILAFLWHLEKWHGSVWHATHLSYLITSLSSLSSLNHASLIYKTCVATAAAAWPVAAFIAFDLPHLVSILPWETPDNVH